jgi:hypothetical protein
MSLITSHKLLTEDFDPSSFEFILEEKNNKEQSTLYVKGPYLVADEVNKNKRRYVLDEMIQEVNRFKKEMIDTGRALGELNHPASAEINPERACHMIVELNQDRNIFIGKSKILSTPLGLLVRSLINDNVRLGMSSRALGKLIEEGVGINRVQEMRLVTVDTVADPSATKAFVNGICESASFVLNKYGQYEQVYEEFTNSLSSLPKHEVEAYLRNEIAKFINSLSTK